MFRACILSLVLSAGLAAQDGLDHATIDLRGLREALFQDTEFPLELPLLTAFIDGMEIACDDGDEYEPPFDALAELIGALGLIDEESDEGVWCSSEGTLEVRAGPANIARVRAFIDAVFRHFTRGATLELIEIDAAALGDRASARLGAGEVREVLKRHAARERSLHRLRLGRRETLSSLRQTTVLGSYGVEVAEKSSMADPETRTLVEGEQASVWIAPRLDGRYRIDLALRAADRRGEMRRIRKVSDAIGMLELPRCGARIFRCSTDLAPGEALVFGARQGAGTVRLLHLRAVDPEAQSIGGLEILPVDHLTRPLRASSLPLIPKVGGNHHFDWEDDEHDEPRAAVEVDRLHELIGERAMLLGAAEGEIEGQLMHLAGDLWLLGPKELRDRAREVLKRLAAPYERTIDCELRWDIVDRANLDDLLAGDDAATAAKLGGRMLLSTRVGDPTIGLSGEEWTYVREKDVEIASDSRIISPVVDGLFAGFACRLLPSVIDGDRLFLDAEIVFQAPAARGEEIDSGRDEIGSIDRESLVRIETRPRVVAQVGAWQLLGVTAIAGSDRSLVVAVRLR